MSLKQRLVNTIITIFDEISYKTFYLPAQEKLYQRYFKPLLSKDEQLPDLIDLIHNVSLVLLNSHPVLQYPRAFVPNAVQIGGYYKIILCSKSNMLKQLFYRFHMTTDDNEMDPVSEILFYRKSINFCMDLLKSFHHELLFYGMKIY